MDSFVFCNVAFNISVATASDNFKLSTMLVRCSLNDRGKLDFGINSVSTTVTISLPNTRLYGENSVDLMAGVMRYAIRIPGRTYGQSD